MIFWVGMIVIFIMSVVFHEVSHGAIAYIRGDNTAKRMGRLTLNPIRHIDWFWTILFPALLFMSTRGQFMIGMAKPVPVNFSNLYHPKLHQDLGKPTRAGQSQKQALTQSAEKHGERNPKLLWES